MALLHRPAGAHKRVGIGLEKYVSIKRTAERALGALSTTQIEFVGRLGSKANRRVAR